MKVSIKKYSTILSVLVFGIIMGIVAKTNASANSQLNLSEKQMLMLSTYAYEINADNLRSVEENLDSMKTNGSFDATKVKSVESGVKPSEFIKVFKDMDKDDVISDLVVVDSIDGYIRAMCLVPSNQVDKKNAEAVIVFLGTKGNNEAWLDNFEGAYNEDTELQLVAGRFFDKVSKKYKVTNVTGHSKGGNLTQYIAITRGDNIRKAVSFDGQGFSDLFFNKYKAKIEQNGSKLTTIASYKDPVHVLMDKLPVNEKIIKTDEEINTMLSHLPNILYEPEYFDANGSYKTTCLTEESEMVDAIEDLSKYIIDNCSDELLKAGCEKTTPIISYCFALGQRILEREDVSIVKAAYQEFIKFNNKPAENYTLTDIEKNVTTPQNKVNNDSAAVNETTSVQSQNQDY